MLKAAPNPLSYLHNQINIESDALTLSELYRSASPYAHLVFENLFLNDLLNDVIDEIGTLPSGSWVKHEDEHLVKFNLRSATELRDAGNRLLQLVHSAAFLLMLSEITGIPGLLPDPYLGGSGYHVIPRGGKFDVHVDRNTEFHSGLTRRLAMLIYLNYEWNPNYGGQFEMWDSNAERCEKLFEPCFNRTLLFEIGPKAFHGVRPVNCPRGIARKSFAVYYHTVGTEAVVPHNSIFPPGSYTDRTTSLHRFSKNMVPPIIWKSVKALLK